MGSPPIFPPPCVFSVCSSSSRSDLKLWPQRLQLWSCMWTSGCAPRAGAPGVEDVPVPPIPPSPPAGDRTRPREALRGRAEPDRARARTAARVHLRSERDDVRLPRGDAEHPRTAAADHDRRMRPLHRPRQDGRAAHAVVRAVMVDRSLGPETLRERERLREPVDARLRWVVRDPELRVIARVPPRAEPELEPAIREEIDRRGLLREHHGVAVVVVEDEAADPQAARDVGPGAERRQPCQLLGDVVGDQEDVVAQVLHAARVLAPLAPTRRVRRGHREAKGTHARTLADLPPYDASVMTATSELSVSVLERVKEAWRPRFLANGIEPYDYEVTTQRIARWEDWLPERRRTAEEHVAAAEEAARAGHRATAAQYKRLAAMCLHFGHFNVVEPESDWLAAQRRKAELFRDVLPYLDPPPERVAIPFAGIAMLAHLRHPRDAERHPREAERHPRKAEGSPRGAGRTPVVLYFSGLDSTKEEATTFEDVLLARGLATVTFDGPGQGETWERMPGRVDWEKAASAVVDFVEKRTDLDASRIVAVGVSLGGYLVMRSAALEPRIRAAAGIGGRFDQSDRDLEDPMHGPRFLHFWGARTVAEARPLMTASTLDGIIEKMDRPVLVVHGARDTLATPENAHRIVERTGGPSTWVLYPEGNHVCNNIPHKSRPLVADWLAQQIGLKV